MIDTPEKQAAASQPEPQDTSSRKAWWIIGGSITGVVLLFSIAASGLWIWTVSSPEEHDTYTEEFHRTVEGVDVEVEIGDIELSAATGDALEVRRDTEWRGGGEPDTDEKWRGDTYTAVGGCAGREFFWIGVNECQVDYTLGLPSGAAAEVNNSVGDIRLDGLDGAIDVESSIGNIEGDDLRSTETVVESSVGDIELEFAQVLGDITVTSETGSIEIVVPDDGTTYAVVFDSSVGDRNVDIASDPGARADYVIRATTNVGDVSIRYGD